MNERTRKCCAEELVEPKSLSLPDEQNQRSTHVTKCDGFGCRKRSNVERPARFYTKLQASEFTNLKVNSRLLTGIQLLELMEGLVCLFVVSSTSRVESIST